MKYNTTIATNKVVINISSLRLGCFAFIFLVFFGLFLFVDQIVVLKMFMTVNLLIF